MDVLKFRAFSVEFLKIAHGFQDADVRQILKTAHVDPTINPSMNTVSDGKKGKAKAYALTGLGGAFTGNGLLTMTNKMRNPLPSGMPAEFGPKPFRAAILGGAALATAGKALRDHSKKKEQEKKLLKTAGFNSSTFTPGRELKRTGEVAKFEKKVHMGQKPETPGLIGRLGRIP